MTPQELKTSILQLAIQGKLVEQRPEEGTGEELYKRIQAEKQKLIKDGKLKKEKPLPEITEDEIPFEIPESWTWIRVGDCVTNRTGLSYKKANLDVKTDHMVRVLRGGNINDTSYALKPDDVMISDQFVKGDLFLKKNTIITPAVTSIERLGKMGRIERDYTDTVVGGFVLMLLPILDDDTFSIFLLYTFGSKYFRDSCRGIVNKSGQAFYNLSRTKLMELLIPLPPIIEQRRIVAKIEELLPLVERYGEAWTKLEEFNKKFPDDMKKSILQQAIQGKLVEQRPEEGTGEELYQEIQTEKQKLIKAGKMKKEKPLPEIIEDEIPFEIPESWKWVRFGDVSSYAQRKEKVSAINISADMWSLDLEDIEKDTGKITNHCLACDRTISGDKVKFKTGNILYSKLRPYLKKVLVAPADGICSSEIVPFVMYGNIEPEYARYFLISPFADGIVNSASYGVKMPRVSTDTMTSLCFPLPPLAEQKRIVAKIEELLPLCEKLK